MSFSFQKLPLDDLKKISLNVKSIWDGATIEGLFYKKLKTMSDGRGDLTELWSEPWSLTENVEAAVKHVYFNTTDQGVIKGWHVHENTHSQYTSLLGKLQIVLIDIRADSPTYGTVNQFVIGEKNPSFINIPPGVLKGWKALLPNSVIINLLSSADTKDNFKYPHDSILPDIWEPKNG